MIQQNEDGSITVGGKTIQKLTVNSALDYYKAKLRNEKPSGKAVLGYTALSKYLSGVKGGMDYFEEWALAQSENSTPSGYKSLSVMESFMAQYGYGFDRVNSQTYTKNLEIFLKDVLTPQLCSEQGIPVPETLQFKDVAGMGDPKFWGTKDDIHVEAYGYCRVSDLHTAGSNTEISVSRHTLSLGEAAESILRHELAHHMEWVKYHCWGDKIFDPESEELVPLDPAWTTGYNKMHSKVFIDCSKALGLTLKGATIRAITDLSWYIGTFASKDITLKTKSGKTFTYDRVEFYKKK